MILSLLLAGMGTAATAQNINLPISAGNIGTGECPMMPQYLFGYTQSKERYCSSKELESIVREYRQRKIPLDMIVQDWSYWPAGHWGEMKMDT